MVRRDDSRSDHYTPRWLAGLQRERITRSKSGAERIDPTACRKTISSDRAEGWEFIRAPGQINSNTAMAACRISAIRIRLDRANSTKRTITLFAVACTSEWITRRPT